MSKGSGTTRIPCHSQIVENQADIEIELVHFLWNASYPFGFYDVDGESPESGDVFKEGGLVFFDSEVIVGLTFPNQVVGDMALSQWDVGGDILALDIGGIEEGDGRFDLVGAFEFFCSPFRPTNLPRPWPAAQVLQHRFEPQNVGLNTEPGNDPDPCLR